MAEDHDYLKDVFAAFGPIQIRNMFGGAGLYRGGVIFAIVAGGKVFLKADDVNRADFTREGKGPFEFVFDNGKKGTMSYYEMPDRLYDDQDEAAAWAERAHAASLRSKKGKGAKPPTSPRTSRGASAGTRRRPR